MVVFVLIVCSTLIVYFTTIILSLNINSLNEDKHSYF